MAQRLTQINGTTENNGDSGFTLTVLGCGTLGIGILSGILSSLSDLNAPASTAHDPSRSGTATPSEELPPRIPSRFIACVRRPESAKRIKTSLSAFQSSITILQNENLKGAQEADVVLLGCKPQMVRDLLGVEGMREALKGKLLISILAGVPVSQIEEVLYGNVSNKNPEEEGWCRIVRVIPNTASLVRESMTVIATSTPPLPPTLNALLTWMFSSIGRVVHLPPSLMDASTALCGSGPAFMALVLEAIADGAVAMGLPRAEAQLMAAQTMRGTAGLVLNGEHPALVREKVSTPGGCTIGGLLVLEEGRVRGTVARAVREATVVASQLGMGVQGVNGTRF
ncbi:MAG: delta 1-pyrroline-5-carboxylate reductase [Pleopsidium flavum]|nr:MAG: delta 1-pyrroline-5-carboxylate reductase [Pleopsidium flavum]